MVQTKVTDRQKVDSVDLTSEVTGTLPVGSGGTGANNLTANNVLLGNGTSALQVVAPSTSGNVLTSNGTTWVSQAQAGGGDVTTTGTQTLTNKTIDGASNTIITGTLTPVRLASHGDETYTISSGTVTQISGTTFDGKSPAVGDRILITGAPASTGVGSYGSTQPGNGIYTVTGNTTNLTVARASDMSGTVKPGGLTVIVSQDSSWYPLTKMSVRTPSDPATSVTWGTTALLIVKEDEIGVMVGVGATQTITNKRVTPRVTTVNAPGATPGLNIDNWDLVNYTGLTAAITSMTTNLAGTPTDGQKLMLTFKDNGTARGITWGASYQSSGIATLLATTVINKKHYVGLIYDGAASKWTCIAVDATGY